MERASKEFKHSRVTWTERCLLYRKIRNRQYGTVCLGPLDKQSHYKDKEGNHIVNLRTVVTCGKEYGQKGRPGRLQYSIFFF